MTAFQPNPDKQDAYSELGGQRPELTDERIQALGEVGIKIESPRVAARMAASEYYEREFGLSGVADRAPEVVAAMKKVHEGYRNKTLPGMANDPERPIEPVDTPEQAAAAIRKQADESWDALESAHDEGRLF